MVIVCVFFCFYTSCVSSGTLQTASFSGDEIVGENFTVFLYGLDNSSDVESLAVLDRSDDTYTIAFMKALPSFRVLANVPRQEAISRAEAFLNGSTLLSHIEKREIQGPDGTVLGYEFRPIYNPFQVNNSSFDSAYYPTGKNRVVFRVIWNEFKEPFSGD